MAINKEAFLSQFGPKGLVVENPNHPQVDPVIMQQIMAKVARQERKDRLEALSRPQRPHPSTT